MGIKFHMVGGFWATLKKQIVGKVRREGCQVEYILADVTMVESVGGRKLGAWWNPGAATAEDRHSTWVENCTPPVFFLHTAGHDF